MALSASQGHESGRAISRAGCPPAEAALGGAGQDLGRLVGGQTPAGALSCQPACAPLGLTASQWAPNPFTPWPLTCPGWVLARK